MNPVKKLLTHSLDVQLGVQVIDHRLHRFIDSIDSLIQQTNMHTRGHCTLYDKYIHIIINQFHIYFPATKYTLIQMSYGVMQTVSLW